MNLFFDHIVHYVMNPELIQKSFSELGFTTQGGGRHQNWGTYNRLCYFANECYIEWIGIDNKKVATESDNPLIRQIVIDAKTGEGFSQFALRTNDIDKLSSQLKQKGLTVIGPVDGSRKQEDGSLLTWSMLFISQQNINECRYPFFIKWGEDEKSRQEKLLPFTKHSIGNAKIGSIFISVKNGKMAAEHWKELFDAETIECFQDKKWNTTCYKIFIGGIEVIFCEPIENNQAQFALMTNGERPFQCRITDTNKEYMLKLFGGNYCLES